MYKSFKPPGVYLTDIQRFTGYGNVKKACELAGIELYLLDRKTYNPLSFEQTYKVLKQIRAIQGDRLLRSLTDSRGTVKKSGVK